MRTLGSFIGGDKVIGKGKAGYFGILDMYIIYFMQFNKITSETSLSYLRCLNSIRRSIVLFFFIAAQSTMSSVQIVQCSSGQNLRYISGDTETVSQFLPSTSAHAASLLQIYQTFLLYDTCRL